MSKQERDWICTMEHVKFVFSKKPFGFKDSSDNEYTSCTKWLIDKIENLNSLPVSEKGKDYFKKYFAIEIAIYKGELNPREIRNKEPYKTYNRKIDASEREKRLRKNLVRSTVEEVPLKVQEWLKSENKSRRLGNYIPDDVWMELCNTYPNVYKDDMKIFLVLYADSFFPENPQSGFKYMIGHEVYSVYNKSIFAAGTVVYSLTNIKELMLEGISYLPEDMKDILLTRYNLRTGEVRTFKEVAGYMMLPSASSASSKVEASLKRLANRMKYNGLARLICYKK